MWLEPSGKNKNSKLLVGTIYRSPSITNIQDWLIQFNDLLSTVVSSWDGLLIIMGDMNINLLDPSSNVTSQYMEVLKSMNLTQHICKPTRTTSTTRTLIDHLISNYSSKITHSDVLPCASISDHDTAYTRINARITRYIPRYKYILNEKSFNINSFKQDFPTLPLQTIYGMESRDDMVGILNSPVSECIDRHVPLRKVNVTRPPASWMNQPEIQELKTGKDRLMHLSMLSPRVGGGGGQTQRNLTIFGRHWSISPPWCKRI